MNGNCSVLQFSSRFGVCTQGLVPKQPLGHLCISQGIGVVHNLCSVPSFCLSWLYQLASLLSSRSTSNRNHPEKTHRLQTPWQALLRRQSPPRGDQFSLRAPIWQKPELTALSCCFPMRIAKLPHSLRRGDREVFITQQVFIEHFVFACSRLSLSGVPEMGSAVVTHRAPPNMPEVLWGYEDDPRHRKTGI